MSASYNYLLVALSLAVSALSSYTALDLVSRMHSSRATGTRRAAWLLGGAVVMGTGIWSMHFIGMLAFHAPMMVGYDIRLTFCSFLIAFLFSLAALSLVSKEQASSLELAIGGLGLGMAIASMHYVGMMALRMEPQLTYREGPFILSIVVGVAASWLAFWIASLVWDDTLEHVLLKRAGAGLILGLATAGMHYIGMSAAVFVPHMVSRAAGFMDPAWLATLLACCTFMLMIATLIFSNMDRGYDSLSERMAHSLEDAHQQLILMATRDPLTDMANRASLLQKMREMIAHATQTRRPFTVMFTDLDGFKTINDSLGHSAGDSLLVEFSSHLRGLVRQGDMVARIGGDEFVILLEGIGGQQAAVPVARNILQRMQRDFIIGATPIRLTASIGLACYPNDGLHAEELLKNADLAMYDAKQKGKNAFRFYDLEMSKAASETLFIYRALIDALEKNQMSLHFQPKFAGLEQNLIGAEALIRWSHPEMGEISPLHFIPIAEQTGQIIKVGNWVIEEVCRHINRWDSEGMPAVKVAINLSTQQLCAPRYIDAVLAIIQRANVTPNRIMFEITETAAMRNADLSAQVLNQFKQAGFDISIDDFGTGYTSLAYLQQFSVNQLKIDRVFIRGLDNGMTGGVAIVAAIIAMAHSLDMVVVAEGVETITQLAKLQALHCDEYQGFLLGRPLVSSAFEALVRGEAPPPTPVPGPVLVPATRANMGEDLRLRPPLRGMPQSSAIRMK